MFKIDWYTILLRKSKKRYLDKIGANMNYVVYHLHSDLSLLDSCTKFKDYVDKAVELGQTAICFTEHSNIYNWIEKKLYCKNKSIKYLHGVEIYLTESLNEKVRDNYHTVLIARNFDGVKEINKLLDLSTQDDHFYYKNRITFDEFLNISDNVITTSACLASPLNRLSEDNVYYERLLQKYDYYEIQPHVNSEDQKLYNQKLYRLSQKYNKPLIAGTDTHSINQYKAECRSLLQKAKKIEYNNEDEYDLTYKSYDELVKMFNDQNCLPEEVYIGAIQNTNVMANSVEDFELDTSFKYPKLYANEEEVFYQRINELYNYKLKNNIITNDETYLKNIEEEKRVFKKIGMTGFILFMSELMTWCRENNIPFSPCRGSVGGSTIAYILDIIDLNPVVWKTVFSRFANEDRVEIGDIDVDISPSQRNLVYEYIINRFGIDYTAYILAIGTISDKGTIDEIGRALHYKWVEEHENEKETNSPYHFQKMMKIKSEYESNPEKAKKDYSELFYYFDGLLDTAISQSMHPAGIIASPVSLPDNYGTFWSDGKRIIYVNMEEVHEVSLVKYDILGLKNIEIIKDTCEIIGIKYPLSHEINWEDKAVWNDVLVSNVGIFQMEGDYAFNLLKQYKPQRINDLSLINAALRPSGASYRDKLIAREFNKNPSEQIDELLKDNNGFLVFQEDTIKFLQNICGLSGSEADNIRRAIGRKQRDRLEKALPQILEGYCNKSSRPRDVAVKEAKTFLQIIEDSADYQFGYNHSTGYSMVGYLCAYFRYYYPIEFITAYLNNAHNQDDLSGGAELARIKGIKIKPIKFRYSRAKYFPDKSTNSIYKGISSIKYCNENIAEGLYNLRNDTYKTFIDLLYDVKQYTSVDTRQLDILIKLDYFSEFGNSRLLNSIVESFNLFKQGSAKQISIDKVSSDVLKNIVSRHSRLSPSGKTYMDLDVKLILEEIEEWMKCNNIEDYTYKQKIKFHEEYVGYIDISTGKDEDRRKLLVLDVKPLVSQKNGKTWAYAINEISIGSGVKNRLTIWSRVYEQNPIAVNDIVYAERISKNNKGYWYLASYKIIN